MVRPKSICCVKCRWFVEKSDGWYCTNEKSELAYKPKAINNIKGFGAFGCNSGEEIMPRTINIKTIKRGDFYEHIFTAIK